MTQPYSLIDPQLFTEHAGANLHVNLSALVNNYKSLQQRVGSAYCSAVVKADAYGLGMIKVAPILANAGCRNFFVAHLDEGIALRSILDNSNIIYVLHGLLPDSESIYTHYNLVPILNDMIQLESWIRYCKNHHQNYAAGLQFDTGMSRFGIGHHDLTSLQHNEWGIFSPVLIMSHLACADTPEHFANRQQLHNFNKIQEIFPTTPASLSASSGIFLGNDWHYHLVRPGIALYGGNPTPYTTNPMESVITLYGKVIQTRFVNPSNFVGYGASFTVTHPMHIALVSVGYADGFFRALGNHKINVISPDFPNIPLPIIGRISMDSLCIDITNLPLESLKNGHYIELIGQKNSIDIIANANNTISYEVLTSLGNRYQRLYFS